MSEKKQSEVSGQKSVSPAPVNPDPVADCIAEILRRKPRLVLRWSDNLAETCVVCGLAIEDSGGYGWGAYIEGLGEAGRVCQHCLETEADLGDHREIYSEAVNLMDALIHLGAAERVLITKRERERQPFDKPDAPPPLFEFGRN